VDSDCKFVLAKPEIQAKEIDRKNSLHSTRVLASICVLHSSLFCFLFSCFSATLVDETGNYSPTQAWQGAIEKIMIKMARVKRGRARDLRTTAVSPTDPNTPRGFTAGICSCGCQVRKCESVVALQGQFITVGLPGLPGRQTGDRPTYYWLLIGYLFK